MHSCDRCSLVGSIQTILTFNVSREIKERLNGGEVEFCGYFTMPGWIGHSGFYVFKCNLCRTVCVDYPHGYTEFGLLFVKCDNCRKNFAFTVPKYKFVYENEDIAVPKAKLIDRVIDFKEQLKIPGKKILIPNPGVPFLRLRTFFRKFRFRNSRGIN